MEYVILPHNEESFLHTLINMELTPLAPVPGVVGSTYSISNENQYFAFIDKKSCEVGFYRIIPSHPYFETLIEPEKLPSGSGATHLVIHNGVLFVGAFTLCGKCLWQAKPGDQSLSSISLPSSLLYKRLKWIESLFVDNNRLIAVNYDTFERLLITYDISNPKNTFYIDKEYFHLVAYSEHIKFGDHNYQFFALFSSANFDKSSTSSTENEDYSTLSILDKKSLTEVWYWSDSLTRYRIRKGTTISDAISNFINIEISQDDNGEILEVLCRSIWENQLPLGDCRYYVKRKEHIPHSTIKKFTKTGLIKPIPHCITEMQLTNITRIIFVSNYLVASTTKTLFKVLIEGQYNKKTNQFILNEDPIFKPVLLSRVKYIDYIIKSQYNHVSIIVFGHDKNMEPCHELVLIESNKTTAP